MTGLVTIDIYNILGKNVSSVSTTSKTEKIDLSDLPSGNYTIQVSNQGIEAAKRISVVK